MSAAAKRDAHPPGKKYRLTDTMKAIIWQLVCLSNEVVRLENEKKWVFLGSTVSARNGRTDLHAVRWRTTFRSSATRVCGRRYTRRYATLHPIYAID